MIYQGTFKDFGKVNNFDVNEQYRVTISSGTGTTINITDPTESQGISDHKVYFSPDPVHITCERSDLSQLIMISQCQIKLKTNQDLSNILCANTNRDIAVTVERITPGVSNSVLFFGYVDPLQFDQGFAYNIEEITLNCTDPLGALEQLMIDQTSIKESDSLQAMSFIYKIFETVFAHDTDKFSGIKTFMSNAINPNNIKINAGIFYGDDEDDRMTLKESLEEILKYLGCTIAYEPNGGTVNMFNIYSGGGSGDYSMQWFDGKEDAMDDSASISIDDAYSKITLTCEIEPVEDEIKLIDDDTMYSDYTNYQKYMTELTALGEGSSAYNGFRQLLQTEQTDYDAGYSIDHYCYVKRSDAWSFGSNSYITAMGGTEGTNPTRMTGDQSNVLRWLKTHPGKAAFVSFGKGNKLNYKDNAPVNNISLTDYLVISVQGHNDHGESGHNTALFNQIQNNSPICSYNGLKSVNLTPLDENVINYIVISGKLILNPLQRKTGTNWGKDTGFDDNWHHGYPWSNLYNASTNTYQNALASIDQHQSNEIFYAYALWHKTVSHPDNGDGAYYTQKWWNCSDPRDPVYTISNDTGIFGFLDNKENEMLKYTYTSYSGYSGDETDVISKLPILACQLKVGDKWCVERLDLGEKGQGVYEWYTLDEWKTKTQLYQKGYDKPYFTIGIDPKTDDMIVGHSYAIQNNIKYTMNVDGSGTAIPIKISDKLNGVPEFTILGPINQMWNEIERIHPSFWRHTSWKDHKFWTLELLDSILVSDLKIELKSNNALYNSKMTSADNDLVYASDMNPLYEESLDCDIKICTPLTMEECQEKGIKYQQSNSYVLTTNDDPFYGWGSGQNKIKPEELFIDYFYKQYNEPAKKLSFCVNNGYAFGAPTSAGSYLGFSTVLSQYVVRMNFPGISGTNNYYCMSMDWSLKNKTNEMTVREMLSYDNPFS